MNTITLETANGETDTFISYDGLVIAKTSVERALKRDFAEHVQSVLSFEVKKDDVFLATFPKAGTHWVWEIIMMLRKGSCEYEKVDKESVFLDLVNPDIIANVPSPRVLSCHYPPHLIPRSVAKKGIKIVHVQRNPKDVFVSYYRHKKALGKKFCNTFEEFIQLMTGAYGIYLHYSFAQYLKEWKLFAKQHPGQVLNISYEDMKEDPTREIKRINTFLKCDRGDELISKIADACSFQNLKKADTEIKNHKFDIPDNMMYRKGEVGDWKNWFTVAQNELIDKWIENNLSDSDINFRYTLE